MCTFVVLQITSSGKLLATVLLVTDKWLLTVVRPHVHLQSLQHIKAFPAAFSTAAECTVISFKKNTHMKLYFKVVAPSHKGLTKTLSYRLHLRISSYARPAQSAV